jgi:hypothetical protein
MKFKKLNKPLVGELLNRTCNMNLHIIKKATFETTKHEDFTNYNKTLYTYIIKSALDPLVGVITIILVRNPLPSTRVNFFSN